MSLGKFIVGNEKIVEGKKIVMVDFYNMVFRYVFIANKNNPLDEKFKNWEYMMTYGLMGIANQFKPDQLIIAVDHGSSWRKQIYEDYKGQREGNRKASAIDFDAFFPILEEYIAKIQDILTNVYVLRKESIEADDFIAILTKRFGRDNEIINISTDQDFYQLYKYEGYKQYHPMKKKFIKVLKPHLELHIKMMTGDNSDNIPNVMKGMGPKTAEKYYGKLDELFALTPGEDDKPGEIESKYIINKQLIDFEMIPLEIQNTINALYDNYDFQTYSGRKTYDCFSRYRLTKSLGYIQEFNQAFSTLKSYQELL
jgi:5'-3' exonuclease